MRPGRITLVIVGGFLTCIGFAALLCGGAVLAVHTWTRDSAGNYWSPTVRVTTPTPVLLAQLDLGGTDESDEPNGPSRVDQDRDRAGMDNLVHTVNLRATRPDGGAVFVGIAPEA